MFIYLNVLVQCLETAPLLNEGELETWVSSGHILKDGLEHRVALHNKTLSAIQPTGSDTSTQCLMAVPLARSV